MALSSPLMALNTADKATYGVQASADLSVAVSRDTSLDRVWVNIATTLRREIHIHSLTFIRNHNHHTFILMAMETTDAAKTTSLTATNCNKRNEQKNSNQNLQRKRRSVSLKA